METTKPYRLRSDWNSRFPTTFRENGQPIDSGINFSTGERRYPVFNGQRVKPGDVFSLTEKQARAFADVFEPA